MIGIILLLVFEIMGVTKALIVCRKRPIPVRIWLGLVVGLMEMMWFPALFAFLFNFTKLAHFMAIGLSLAISAGLVLKTRSDKKELIVKGPEENGFPLKSMLIFMIPIALLVGYLQYTHNFRPVDGALHVGQSTYGDINIHASFATGLPEHDFPPDYILLPGNRLGYPFLVDALSGSMLLFGSTLNLAFFVPGTLMTVLVFAGFFFFAWELTHSKKASTLALLLMLFNGGLGFAYTLDRMGETECAALKEAFNGFYQAPANLVDQNIRWVNFLCDLLIPQRTLMAGWMCLIPAFYMLYTGLKSKRRSDFIALGLFAGPLVMIHTHSFMALGIISFGVMVDILLRDKESRKENLFHFLWYGGITCLIAMPQILIWTIPQSSRGEGYLKVFFNWANNTGSVLRDEYLWFWIKNVGPIFIFLFLAGINAKKREDRAWSLGALITFLLADCVLFQPLAYDNNKIFCAAYLAMLPLAAQLLCRIYEKLKDVKGRSVLAVIFLFICMASGVISITVEAFTDYELYGKNDVAAADYIKKHTSSDALFLTGQNHNNTAASLAGRNIVCGSSTFLYFHGLDYGKREADAALMLNYPERLRSMYEEYGVDYVYVSAYERGDLHIDESYVSDETLRIGTYHVNEEELAALYPVVFSVDGDWDGIRIYAVSERAIEQYNQEMSTQ